MLFSAQKETELPLACTHFAAQSFSLWAEKAYSLTTATSIGKLTYTNDFLADLVPAWVFWLGTVLELSCDTCTDAYRWSVGTPHCYNAASLWLTGSKSPHASAALAEVKILQDSSPIFQKTRDAMVAFELARHFETASQPEEAVKWYALSWQRFRRGDWKRKRRKP